MKRTLFVLLMVVVFLLSGCEKQAEPIILPSVNDIDSIDITTLDGSVVSYSDKEWVEQFIAVVTQAKSTTKKSVQDIPGIETYGKVDISNNGEITTFFYYIENEKYYIEQPYQGIYRIDINIDTLVKGAE